MSPKNETQKKHEFDSESGKTQERDKEVAPTITAADEAIDSNGERSGLLTHIATTESVSSCARMKS